MEACELHYAAVLAWMLPATFLMIGAAIGQYIYGSDLASMFGGITGCGTGLLFAPYIARIFRYEILEPKVHLFFNSTKDNQT